MGMLAPTYKPSAWEAEARGLKAGQNDIVGQRQLELHSKTPSRGWGIRNSEVQCQSNCLDRQGLGFDF